MAWAAVLHKTSDQRRDRAAPGPQTTAHRNQALRLGQQILLGSLPAASAALAYSDLADARIRDCAAAAFGDQGLMHNRVAVLAVGDLGARQMTAASPLHLLMVHEPQAGDDAEALAADCDRAFRLMAAGVAGSARDTLYSVQAQAAGALPGVEDALRAARPARLMILSQARMVWSSSPALSSHIRAAITQILRRPRDAAVVAHDAALLRRLRAQRLPSGGVWDCDREPGGLLDIDAFARRVQVAHASYGAPLIGSAGQALAALHQEQFLSARAHAALSAAWSLQQSVAQILAAALPAGADPEIQPAAIQAVIAAALGAPLPALKTRLIDARFEAVQAML